MVVQLSGSADGTGEYYRDLDQGFYTATATDRVSGCTSAPVTEEIKLNTEDPKFNIELTNTICNEQSGLVVFVPVNTVEIQTIEWDINGMILNGPILSNLPAGNYTVTAISSLQCQASLDFELKSDLNIYNGVSRNNDGMNDFFEIGCIDEFPGNNVRIFNRAGALVYEANGYNNGDILFNGISNRGVNLLGSELPDGTYFYIVTKNDGSEPKTGYLELMH